MGVQRQEPAGYLVTWVRLYRRRFERAARQFGRISGRVYVAQA